MSDLGSQVAFYSLAALTLYSGFCVVQTRNVLHAGFWLLPCFVGIAGLFATLEAHFFFVVQLLIYAGAILVLILFALMLTRDVMNPAVRQTNRSAIWAGLCCAAASIGASWVLVRQPWKLATVSPLEAQVQTAALGKALIGPYVVPFEVASLLLLAALIGSVMLAKDDREDAPEPPPLPADEENG